MMTEQVASCNKSEIRAHLGWITRRWHELREPAELALRSYGEHLTPQHARFGWTPEELDRATEWALDVGSRNGRNIYPVVNPLRPGGGAGSDDDVICAFFHWADSDSELALNKLNSWAGPRWRYVVRTGTVPFIRTHVYWELEAPQYDLAAWRRTQQAIAAQLSTDSSVINPSRIMKLAGTVSWPDDRKRERGYVPETTKGKEFPDRPLVDAETFARAFGDPAQEPAQGFSFDNGALSRLDRKNLEAVILTDEQWRPHVMKWVASSIARGWEDDEVAYYAAAKFTRPGYTFDQTVRDVAPLIAWCREQEEKKHRTAKSGQAFDFSPQSTERSDGNGGTWRVETAADFIAGFVAPEYLIDGVVQRGRLYTLTAPTGSGKTAVMLYASAMIASGEPMCGRETEQGAVIFLAGENPDDVRARVIATLDHFGIDPHFLRLFVIAGTFSIRADMERLVAECERIGDVALIVVDTFAAYFDGDDENSNAQALDFARVVRRLTGTPSKPTVIMPAHPVKNAARTNLTPKGGSSLLNEVDGNLTIWNDDGRVKMHHQAKHRGPDFDPLMIELTRVENSKIHDKHGRIMPSVVAQPITERRATELAAETYSLEDRLLMQIEAYPALSVSERCARLCLTTAGGGAHKSKLQRTLMKLRDEKLIRQFRGQWELTKDGERALEMARQGAPKGAEIE